MPDAPDPPDADDRALLDRARAGDRAALDALVEKHQARVYRYSRRLCHDPEDARDATQETLLAMARGVHDFRGDASLPTWLYTVARSFCIKARRRSKHAPDPERSLDDVGDSPALADPAPGPEQSVATHQLGSVVETAIAELDPRYREVMVLRDIEGLSAAEVAEVMGLTVDAVKSRLHRARHSVRARVVPLVETPPPAPGAPPCPDVIDLLSRRLEGEITADACAEMDRHLQRCPRCTGACQALRRSLALCRQAADVEVPAEVQASIRAALRGVRAG